MKKSGRVVSEMGDVVEMVKGRKEKLREEAGKMIAVGIAKNIDRLMTMQMELDRRIIEGRGLQGRDLIPNEMPYKVYRRMDLIDQFHAMFDMAGIAYVPNQWHWAVSVFLGLADMLGFTWDDIESAYLAKNQVNLARQERGY